MNRTPISLALAYLFAAVAILLVLGMLVRTSQATKANTETLALIRSCTIKPAGRCAEIQREQLAGFTRLLAITVACGDRPGVQSAAQVERCVDRRLKRLSADRH